MKRAIVAAGIMLTSLSAHAAMYKCTEADGNVSFSDKHCPGEKQEALREPAAPSPPPDADDTEPDAGIFTGPDAITPLAGGRKVTSSSPLAWVYTSYLGALKRCDRDEAMKYVSSRMAAEMAAASESGYSKEECLLLLKLLPKDFENATEVIEGDRGTIHWLTVETTTDGAMTSSMKLEQPEEFVREGGVWKLSQ
jgi:hypothetical protein